MTDKELGNPENNENNPLDGSPKEESNLEKSTGTENEVVESEIVEPVVVTPEPINDVVVNESTLNTEEAIVPQPLDDQDLTENSSASVPPSNNNTSRNIWMGLSLVLAIVLVIVLVKPSGDSAAVATVNGVDITKDKLYSELVTLGGTQTLDNLITEELIDQEVKKANITVTEDDLTKEIESVKKNFATEEEFNSALTQSGMTLDDLKNEMNIQVKIRKLVEPQVKVTDADIKKYFDENPGAFDTAEQVKASHILVATKEEADSILKEIKGGSDFATVAAAKSLDTASKDKGGDLDFFPKGTHEDAFDNAAFALEKDQLSDVVQSASGFHIIKVTDRKDAHKATLEEKSAEIKEQLTTTQVSTLSSTWLSDLKTKADIKNTLDKKDDATTDDATDTTTDTGK